MKRAITTAGAVLLLCAALTGGAYAQGLPVGVVSIAEALAKSAYVNQGKQDLAKLVEQKNADLDAQRQAVFVTSLFSQAELEEAQSLAAKANLTDQEKARQQELTKLSSARLAEWQTLQQKTSAQLTPEQTQRLAELDGYNRAAKQREQKINEVQQQMQQDVDKAVQTAQDNWQKRLQEALQQVAKQASLLLLLEADSLPYFDPALVITDKVTAALDAAAGVSATPPPQ